MNKKIKYLIGKNNLNSNFSLRSYGSTNRELSLSYCGNFALLPFNLEGRERLVILNENKKIYLILYLLPYLRLHSVLVKNSYQNLQLNLAYKTPNLSRRAGLYLYPIRISCV